MGSRCVSSGVACTTAGLRERGMGCRAGLESLAGLDEIRPESSLDPLAQGVTYLASAPKSNASYRAMNAARDDARKLGALPVPLHLRNAPTKLMRKLGYGEDYLYPHDFADAVVPQSHLPDQLDGRTYYSPSDRGYEARIREYLDRVRRMRAAARSAAADLARKKRD